jgi:dipeptidyl aminopeptidase/acylaminoacyl peptidase
MDAQTGKATRLTQGPFDVGSASWSPDGKQIAYTRTRTGATAHCTDVWLVKAAGGAARRLSHEQSQALYPKWSGNGRWIVFSGAIEEGDAQARLWLIEVASGQVRALGDESIEISTEGDGVHWCEDSAAVMATVATRGCLSVVEVQVPSGRITPRIGGERQLQKLAFTKDWFVFTADRPHAPVELITARRDGSGDEKQLSHFNDWWHERVQAKVERRTFTVPDGDGGMEDIEGWLLRPAKAKGPAPLLLDVHGGPASFVLFGYPSTAYWPVLWSRGWAILALNTVGSASFGRDFSARLRGRWGEMDLPQHLAAARALQQEGIADERLAMAGKSYGGYLTAWAIGQTPQLRAAVVSAPVANIESHAGVSDSGYYADPYSMCGKGSHRELMRRLSPSNHVEKACTPTLILQGEDDQRCPRSQSEELFVTMRTHCDAPSELVLYPGGSHHFLDMGKPSHRLDAVSRIVDWLARWAGAAEGQKKAARPEARAAAAEAGSA